MLQITENDVKKALSISEIMAVVRQAYRDNWKQEIYAGPRGLMNISGQDNVGQWLTANSKK
ncbi:hypothetical protein HU830_02715 [Lactobacillus sp. DCY120]|uniref:Uncharacterized protein n=1 Tax=Bombilactobacillus apium TaxID=2675299 RepID=A0A850R9N1_9LACO|nr:hypothetical protein [Bombilactobacillus apium]NVY96096.1 hypothetical protein [Bombilactobacillus apium]